MTDISHFYGMPVKEIVKYGDEDADWAIEMEDGTQIRNYDGRRTAAPDIPEGYALLTVMFSAQETRLSFGVDPRYARKQGKNPAQYQKIEITLTPTSYSLADGRVKGEIYPQQIDPEEREALVQTFAGSLLRVQQRHEELPPDPSPERTRTDEQVEAAESDSEGTEGEDGTD